MDSVFSVPPEQLTFQPHVLLFPFMSKGHTIPLLHFAHLLLRRGITVTLVTTPANRHFVAQSLRHTTASVVVLPFPDNVPDVPPGIESTDKLPSMSLFFKFATATVHMQPHLERELKTLPRVSFMVSDGFLWWTLHSASKFGIPRLVYYGMSCYAVALSREAAISGILNGPQPDHELVNLTALPWIRLSKNDFAPEFRNPDPNSLASQFHMNTFTSTASSFGVVVNSFYELEPVFVEYMNKESIHPKSYCVGPFCLADDEPCKLDSKKPKWVEWLDKKGEEGGCGVVYVAFGSQAEMSGEQLKEIARGLEESGVDFLWVIRKDEWEIGDGFEERVKERGMVVREWVEQREILMHESVKGFVSHCGWNSVLEGICAGVPILGWPVMAEQPLNARMVEEELRVGLRVERSDGTVRGEELREKVRELMEGERGREARKKVKEVAEMAKKAVEPGGSSWRTLESLLVHTCTDKQLSS